MSKTYKTKVEKTRKVVKVAKTRTTTYMWTTTLLCWEASHREKYPLNRERTPPSSFRLTGLCDVVVGQFVRTVVGLGAAMVRYMFLW